MVVFSYHAWVLQGKILSVRSASGYYKYKDGAVQMPLFFLWPTGHVFQCAICMINDLCTHNLLQDALVK